MQSRKELAKFVKKDFDIEEVDNFLSFGL